MTTPLPNAGAAPEITSIHPATLYVLLAVGVILLLWEAWTLRRKDDDFVTITSTIRFWTVRWPLLPFLAGVLVGHFWW